MLPKEVITTEAHTKELREYKFNDMILKVTDKSIITLPEVKQIIIKANEDVC